MSLDIDCVMKLLTLANYGSGIIIVTPTGVL